MLTGELKDVLAGRTEDEEAMCAVCSGGLSIAPNLIVFCERCDIAVHQKCYGVDDIPAGISCSYLDQCMCQLRPYLRVLPQLACTPVTVVYDATTARGLFVNLRLSLLRVVHSMFCD